MHMNLELGHVVDFWNLVYNFSYYNYIANLLNISFFPGPKDYFHINLEDEVVRGALVLNNGDLTWPPPPLPVQATAPAVAQPKQTAVMKSVPNPFVTTSKEVMLYTAGIVRKEVLLIISLHIILLYMPISILITLFHNFLFLSANSFNASPLLFLF